VEVSCEHGNEPWGCIKRLVFITKTIAFCKAGTKVLISGFRGCLKKEVHLNNILKRNDYLTRNRRVTFSKMNQLTIFWEMIAVYCENHMVHVNSACTYWPEYSGSVLKS
jgi:hypothetical protein